MNLRNLMRLFGSWLWLIVLSAGAVGGLVYLIMERNGSLPRYSAEAVVAVGGDVYRDAQDTAYVELASTMLANYLEVATMGIIVDPVISRLGLELTQEEMAELVDVSSIEGTNLIAIRVTHADPALAANIANGIASQLTTLAPARWTNFVMLIEAADVPDQSDIFALLPVVLSGCLAALLVAGLILFREFMRDPLYNEQETREALGLPVVAILEPMHFFSLRHLFNREWLHAADSVLWSLKETCLKSSEISGEGNRAPFIMLTSAGGSEQSLAAMRLAAAWPGEADEVLLADLDLEQQGATNLSLGAQPEAGFATIVESPGTKLADLLVFDSTKSALRILPAGSYTTPPSPESLKSGLGSFLTQREANVTVVASAPLPDSSVITLMAGQQADVNLLVIEAQITPRIQAKRIVDLLAVHDVVVKGAILSYVPYRSIYRTQKLRELLVHARQYRSRQTVAMSRMALDEGEVASD